MNCENELLVDLNIAAAPLLQNTAFQSLQLILELFDFAQVCYRVPLYDIRYLRLRVIGQNHTLT